MDDLGHAADRGRDDGDTHRERLDRGMGQVLVVAREHRSDRAGDDLERVVSRARAAELDPAVRAGPGRVRLEARPLRSVADDDEPRLRHLRERLDRGAERLRRCQPPDEDEGPGRQLLRVDVARRRRGVRQHVDAARIESPAGRDLALEGARDDDRDGAPERRVPQALQQPHGARACALELLQRPPEEPRSAERARRPGRRRA